jgi:hypothetical protein
MAFTPCRSPLLAHREIEMNTRMMFAALVAVVLVCGCVNNDCSGTLPIPELFGAKLAEPWGGKLQLNDCGRGGADDVSEWLDYTEWLNEQTNDVQSSRFCGRGYYYEDPRHGKDGYDGSIMLDVFRTDMGVRPVE